MAEFSPGDLEIGEDPAHGSQAVGVVERLSEALLQVNQSGISILLVEQDVMTAFELARRGFVLESGRVTLSGPTSELATNPTFQEAYMGI